MKLDLDTAIMVASSDFVVKYPERPEEKPIDGLITRVRMRQRVQKAIEWGFKRGVEWQKEKE